jgi:hypothetical protein
LKFGRLKSIWRHSVAVAHDGIFKKGGGVRLGWLYFILFFLNKMEFV